VKRVLVTHADLPLGRRIVKLLWHDPAVARIFALGGGPLPRTFAAWRGGEPPRLVYERVDLARQRSVADLFRSQRMALCAPDTAVLVPLHGAAQQGPPVVARVPERVAEVRLVLRHAIESKSIQSLVAVGSALVYAIAPGNANHLTEDSPLDLDANVPPSLRAWIDCDMLLHTEAAGTRLRVVLLRVPTVVASGGFVYLHPALEGGAGPRLRPAGFDPLCPVIADKDVARAVQVAVHADVAGVFNVAGREAIPLSVLGRWTERPSVPVPGPLLRVASAVMARAGGGELAASLAGPHARYGMSLDTQRAATALGFEPRYRVGVARAGDGSLRLEAVAAR
jgi:nucleoside-diphosphate-sugar epimerase